VELVSLGYVVIGIQTRAEDALHSLKTNLPDLILMDINLAGKMDEVDMAIYIQKNYGISVIFLTHS